MAGLDPAIQGTLSTEEYEIPGEETRLDGRVKPGHDGKGG